MIDPKQRTALRVQLAIIGGKTPGELIEVRYRTAGGFDRKWFDAADELREAERFIVKQGAKTDTYVGAAPRIRRGGTAADVAHARCLWADIDRPDAVDALNAFDGPPPALIIASGRAGHLHGWWPLAAPIPVGQIADANKRLARALGGDLASTDPARILRAIATTNHKPDGGPVRCVRFSRAAYNGDRPTASEVVGDLPEAGEAALSEAINLGGGAIIEGERDTTLTRIAGHMKRGGMTADEIHPGLVAVNTQRCRPPLPEKDLRRIARSIGKKPAPTDPAWLDFPRSDAGNASRLVYDHGAALRYVPGKGWHCADGQRWKPDGDGEVMRRARESAGRLRVVAAETKGKEQADALFKFATRSESEQRLNAAVRLAATDAEVIAHADDLDADPMLLNVVNGTVDLRMGTLRSHDPRDLLTKLCPVTFDRDAKCPRWLKFVREVFDGDDDLIAFVQRAVGYTITGDTREQVLFLPYGTGANGKSTFIETIAALAGDYAVRADASTFTQSHRRSVRSDIARLRGARFVPATEVETSARLAEVLVKQVTGGDTITASHLYREEFEFRPAFKVWLTVNHLPIIRDDGHAIWRRIRAVPFTVTVTKPDRALPDKLRAELPGILNWAVQGALAWQRDGLKPPAAVADANEAYRASQDPLAGFLEDQCDFGPDGWVSRSDLYAAYVLWARTEAVDDPLSRTEFQDRIGSRGVTAVRRRKAGKVQRVWLGLALRDGESA